MSANAKHADSRMGRGAERCAANPCCCAARIRRVFARLGISFQFMRGTVILTITKIIRIDGIKGDFIRWPLHKEIGQAL